MSFRRYESYRDTVPWLGTRPSHWNLIRFKQIFRERDERSADGSEELLSVSAYTGVSPRREIIDEGEHLSRAESLEGYKKCRPNDLVMNIMLAWNRGLGFARQEGIVSPAYCVFQVKDDSSPRYLDYLLRSDDTIRYFKAFSAGVIDSRLRLYPDSFLSLSCVLPPLPEQAAIAAFLDRETAKIDALVAEQRRLIELLKEKRQAVISLAVTKGLDPSVPMKDSGVEWLGEVPAHWRVVPLKWVTVECCDGPFGSGLKSEHYVDDGVRVVRLQNITSLGFDASDAAYIDADYFRSELTRHEVRGGDVLIAGLGDDRNVVGRACVAPSGVVPAIVKADCFRFRLDEGAAVSWFVAHQLNASAKHSAGTLATGSTRSRIPLSTMMTRPVALPPIAEQQQIVRALERQLSEIECLSLEAERSMLLLQERRSALISAAVTGKIDVRDAVPAIAEAEAA